MPDKTVLKLLKGLDENKAVGLDNLSDNLTVLAKPNSQICNLSIKYSIFPSDYRIAKLKPLFKKGSKTTPKIYRLISLLSLIFKVIEKVIHDQTQSSLDENNFICRYQSNFSNFFSLIQVYLT